MTSFLLSFGIEEGSDLGEDIAHGQVSVETLLEPFGQFVTDRSRRIEAQVDQQDLSEVVGVAQCPPNSLVQSPHAQIFVVVSPLEASGAFLVVERHPLLHCLRLGRGIGQAADNDSPRELVAEVDAFR